MEPKNYLRLALCLVFAAWAAVPAAGYPGNWRPNDEPAPAPSRLAGVPSPVVDPAGDTFGILTPQLDINTLTVTYDATDLHFEMTFFTPIAPASASAPESMVGQVEFDTDQNPTTGNPPWQNSFSPPATAVTAGIDFLVDFTSEQAHPGLADVRDAASLVLGTIPLTFGPTSVAGSIPLAMLGGDDGVVDYTGIIGTYPEPTDAMDVLGTSTDPTAPVNTFTINDGVCEFRATNLIGQRATANGGIADLTTSGLENLFQNWFWYRATDDSREYALSNQVAAEVSSNHARLLYTEPAGDGAAADALLFDIEYTLTDLGADTGAEPPACARCEVVMAVRARNRVGQPLNVALFSYNDMDVRGNAGGDSAIIAGADNQAQLVFQGQTATQNAAAGVYKVSSGAHTGWEIGPFAAVRNKLTDGDADNLANAGSPFGPGDYTGAQQWSIQLGAGGSVLPPDAWIGSVVTEVTVFRDGDADGDCDVDLYDHAMFQESFTGPLP